MAPRIFTTRVLLGCLGIAPGGVAVELAEVLPHCSVGGDPQPLGLLQVQSQAWGSRQGSYGPAAKANAAPPTYSLNDGHNIPMIGLGTYRMSPGTATYTAVRTALEVGYRMFDTARIYMNEADVGRAIRDSKVPRSEIFVSTKIWNDDHGYDRALAAGKLSNQALGLGYIDLLLIHSPFGPAFLPGRIIETYDALLDLQKQGVVRSVGVSNFGVQHLKALADYCRPAPVVNQVELHPLAFSARQDLVRYCKSHDILIQPYGSVLSGHGELLSLAHAAATVHNKTAAQVMLRWALDHGFQVIPKSTHRQWIQENADVFDFTLTKEELSSLDSLKAPPQLMVQRDGSLTEYWNPLVVPVHVGNATSHCKTA